MRVLLAFDKFKDALTAPEACAVAEAALTLIQPGWSFDSCPLADGGDGFTEVLTRAVSGTLVARTVSGPSGRPARAVIGLVPLNTLPDAARRSLDFGSAPVSKDSKIAVIEMAQASGLALLQPEERDLWNTTTLGTGELIRAAVESGADGILLGVGGSATHDLGLGALAALGIEFRLASGQWLHPPTPSGWREIERISGRISLKLPPIRIACDTRAPLLGRSGAAALYGFQKGLRPADRPRLEHESARMAMMLGAHFKKHDDLIDTPGAGAAGGLPFGLLAATDARIVPGAELVAAWLDLDRRIAESDIIITGEGRFDAGSLTGKGPSLLIEHGIRDGKHVHLFAGRIDVPAPVGCRTHSITPDGTPTEHALRNASGNLENTLRTVFSDYPPRAVTSVP